MKIKELVEALLKEDQESEIEFISVGSGFPWKVHKDPVKGIEPIRKEKVIKIRIN